ncbi:class II glutamine amidotransferase [uncultured Bifidobacterium sp.]|uniref:class II glutamine amidotransferase n=1 Tax=uncultured Bifidobacterium sp. TaxID=165187 RepID=UPI0026112AC7|nr:class II glutamine amidotransferase [uncultured Bifidobacterium sp.]
MCRLLGYATNGLELSLTDVIGEDESARFRDLGRIHNDGWGACLVSAPNDSPFRRDGGEPVPETMERLYRSIESSVHDSMFPALATQRSRGAIWHLRLASSHLPLVLGNQQPFATHGLSFIHNGDISNDEGRNIVDDRDFPVTRSTVLSTGGESDSAVFFAVVIEQVGLGLPLDEAVCRAVRKLRERYPLSSFNCMVQSRDELVVLRAAGREGTPQRVVDVYESYGRGDEAADYRAVRYRPIADSAGAPVGVVVASSGFPQPASLGWRELGNNHLLIASNHTGQFRIRSL